MRPALPVVILPVDSTRASCSPMPGRPWTEADDQLARTLPPAEVARRTGRTLSAVYHRRRLLNPADLKRPWTPAEDRLLMRLPPAVAAKYLRRSAQAIDVRRWRLGLVE